LIIIIRSDISDGYKVVQAVHAIAEFAAEHPQTFAEWKKESNSIICLSVKDEESLLKLFEKLDKKTPSSSFYEPDVSSFTAICVYGTSDIRKSLSHLPLVLNKKSKVS